MKYLFISFILFSILIQHLPVVTSQPPTGPPEPCDISTIPLSLPSSIKFDNGSKICWSQLYVLIENSYLYVQSVQVSPNDTVKVEFLPSGHTFLFVEENVYTFTFTWNAYFNNSLHYCIGSYDLDVVLHKVDFVQPKCPFSQTNVTLTHLDTFSYAILESTGSTLPTSLYKQGAQSISAFKNADACNMDFVVQPQTDTYPQLTINHRTYQLRPNISIANWQDYSDITIQGIPSHAQGNGVYVLTDNNNDPSPFTFTLILTSSACGIQKIPIFIRSSSPRIRSALTPLSSCSPYTANLTISVDGVPDAIFTLDGETFGPEGYIMGLDSVYDQLSWKDPNSMWGDSYPGFNFPPSIFPLSLKPIYDTNSCTPYPQFLAITYPGPVSDLTAVHESGTNLTINPETKQIIAPSTGGKIHISSKCYYQTIHYQILERTVQPVVRVESSTCIQNVTVKVLNAEKFESPLTLVTPTGNLTTNGDMFTLPPLMNTQYLLVATVKGCNISTNLTISPYVDDLTPDQVQLVITNLTLPSTCSGLGRVVGYFEVYGQRYKEINSTFQRTQELSFILNNYCSLTPTWVAPGNIIDPQFSLVINTIPTCNQSLGNITVSGQGLVYYWVNENPFIIMAGKSYQLVPGPINLKLYYGGEECFMIYNGSFEATDKNYDLGITIQPQSISNCSEQSGYISIPNFSNYQYFEIQDQTGTFVNLTNGKMIMGPRSNVPANFEHNYCGSGQITFSVTTEPPPFTVTTTLSRVPSCASGDGILDVVIQGTPPTMIFVNPQINPNPGPIPLVHPTYYNGKIYGIVGSTSFDILFQSSSCQWTKTINVPEQSAIPFEYNVQPITKGVGAFATLSIPSDRDTMINSVQTSDALDFNTKTELIFTGRLNINVTNETIVYFDNTCVANYSIHQQLAPPVNYTFEFNGCSLFAEIVFDTVTSSLYYIIPVSSQTNGGRIVNGQLQFTVIQGEDVDFQIMDINTYATIQGLTIQVPYNLNFPQLPIFEVYPPNNCLSQNNGKVVITNYDSNLFYSLSGPDSDIYMDSPGQFSGLVPDVDYLLIIANNGGEVCNGFFDSLTVPSYPQSVSVDVELNVIRGICKIGANALVQVTNNQPWVLPNLIYQINGGNAQALTSGTFEIPLGSNNITIIAPNDCSVYQGSYQIASAETLIQVQAQTNDNCGEVVVTISGGFDTSQYTITIFDDKQQKVQSGNATSSTQTFTGVIGNGVYQVLVEDASGCQSSLYPLTLENEGCDNPSSSSIISISSLMIVLSSLITVIIF